MDIAALDRWLEERSLLGFWNQKLLIGKDPVSSAKPYLWKGRDILQALDLAAEGVGMEQTMRRNISLRHPSVEGGAATPTIQLSFQLLKPGEVAKAHRHNATAIRFVVRAAPGAYTVVEGERLTMDEGDLITTPNWTWHDHHNRSKEPVIWLDGLDVHLVRYLEVWSFELSGQAEQPEEKPQDYISKRYSFSRPSWMKEHFLVPPFHYKWKDTYASLETLKAGEGDPFDGVLLRYVNPANGGATFPTFSCEIQLLRPGEETRSHRHTSSAFYYAFRGSGRTIVGDVSLEWEQGDVFVVPLWYWHHHINSAEKDAILFSINDRPLLEPLGFYREEAS